MLPPTRCELVVLHIKLKGMKQGRYSLCLPKLKSITVLLYGVSTKNETFLLFVLLFKLCSTFNLRTFSHVLSTVIKIFKHSILHVEKYNTNSLSVERKI